MNLDPFHQHDDHDIFNALVQSKFIESLSSASSSSSSSVLSSSSLDLMQSDGIRILDYVFTDGGSKLSSGQRQLLCLGRLFLQRTCKYVLVDEATANVDNYTEQLLYAALRAHLDEIGATLLMICHKLDNINALCNTILHLNDGTVLSFKNIN